MTSEEKSTPQTLKTLALFSFESGLYFFAFTWLAVAYVVRGPVKNEEGFAHILIILPLQKLLTEPNIEAAVILGLQITAFGTN